MSEPSPACGVKKPFPKYRPDRAGWPPIFIAFYTLAECAFLTLLPQKKNKNKNKNKNEEQMRVLPSPATFRFHFGRDPG